MRFDYKEFEIESKPNTNAWLLSFADLLSIILSFFILIYSFAEPQQNKYDQVKSSLAAAGAGQSSNSDTGNKNPSSANNNMAGTKEKLPAYMPTTPDADYLGGFLDNIIRSNNLSNDIKITKQNSGIYISINYNGDALEKYNVFFDSFLQLINAINNQIEIAYKPNDENQAGDVAKNISTYLREKGYSKQILELYGNNLNSDTKEVFEKNRLLILIRPYEVFR